MEKSIYEIDFLNFRKELSSFIFRIVSNKEDTEDIVQDTYIKTFANLDSFLQKSSFKTWVFTIAVNIARNHLKAQNKWVENAQDIGATLHMQSEKMAGQLKDVFYSKPNTDFEIREHINYCLNCITKTLELHQQLCILLKDVYEFKVNEIMEITGLSEGKVKHALADARKNMIRIFDHRCAFINKTGICHQCTSLKGILNPLQDAHIKANEIRLVKEGQKENKEYLLDLRLQLARGIDPLNSPNAHLHTYLIKNIPAWVELGSKQITE